MISRASLPKFEPNVGVVLVVAIVVILVAVLGVFMLGYLPAD
jgi:FlaG/FlaF family flagellin (archaellin)